MTAGLKCQLPCVHRCAGLALLTAVSMHTDTAEDNTELATGSYNWLFAFGERPG